MSTDLAGAGAGTGAGGGTGPVGRPAPDSGGLLYDARGRAEVAAVPPRPSVRRLAPRVFAYWMTNYKRTWRGTAVTSVLEPVFFLAAMGVGIGTLVNRHGADTLPGGSYLAFIAPGMLAATVMQNAMFDSSYPVLGAIKWDRCYFAQLATEVRVVDVLVGHLGFILFRVSSVAVVFVAVMAVFGVVESAGVLLAVLSAILTGMAFACAVFAFAVRQESDSGFAMLFRFATVPMFLFSGTFFPIEQLPAIVQPLAWITPLWHGVALARGLSLGGLSVGMGLLHFAYLVVFTAVAFWIALRGFEKRLAS